jgi:S1-C subfamily serine protease
MSSAGTDAAEVLAAFSNSLAGAVERAGASVVRVEARRRQAASGVVWGQDGLILTADHVLERDEDIAIGLPDGGAAAASIVGRDPGTDLALLRVQGAALAPVQRGPAPKVGHVALVVARPGAALETSVGFVSALVGPARTGRGGRLEGLIRTDAVLYPGFSGGALVDASGALIGLATSHFGHGAGLAIPLETAERVAGALQSHGRVKRGFLGLVSQPVAIPEGLRGRLGLSQESGLLVSGVEAGGPAEQGGLMVGDVVVALGGQPIRHTEDLLTQLSSERVGQQAAVRVIRGGESRDLTVTIGERQ